MKKTITTLATIAFLTTFQAEAASSIADVTTPGPSLGIQAGLDFSNASTPSQLSTNSYTGFSVGLNLGVPLTSQFSIQPEINYTRHGLNLVEAGNASATAVTHSLEVPVFARLNFGDRVRPYVFAGPEAIFNISNSVEGNLLGKAASISYDPKTVDFAAVGGVGLELESLFINLRYSMGLVNFNKNSSEWYSRGFKLVAGLRI